MDPRVRAVELQKPKFRLKKSLGRYTADLDVQFRRPKPTAFEFKYEAELRTDAGLKKFHSLVKDELAEQGYDFEVQTDEDVYKPDFSMLAFAFRYRNLPEHPVCHEILGAVRQRPGIPVHALLMELAGTNAMAQAEILPDIWRLVGLHRLRVDFLQVLNLSTELFPTIESS